MTSPKYIGYLGGAAVAAGVGAVIAVGGAATAYAEGTDTKSDSKSETTSTESKGPKKEPSTRLGKTASKLEQRVTSVAREARDAREARIERASKFDPADAVKDLQKRFTKAAKAADKAEGDDVVTEAETQQPKRLNLAAKAAETARALNPAPAPAPLAAAVQTEDVAPAASTDDLFSNPFRADDPAPQPAGMFGPFLDIRTAVLDASPEALEPFVREGYEAGYRVSQMVPWVNLPIPLLHIAAATGDPDQSVAQVGINQLLLTLPPLGIAYYGYDQVADLINMEVAAAALKEDFYRTVWDTLDPLELLHDRGNAGLP